MDEGTLHRQIRPVYEQLLTLLPRGVCAAPGVAPYFTAYEFGTLFDWDLYFESIVLAYAGYPAEYARNGAYHFLDQAEAEGYTARTFSFNAKAPANFKHEEMAKPFLAQTLWHYHQRGGTFASLRDHGRYETLKRFVDRWFHNYDRRGAGLSVWRSAGHTGMDNHFERAGLIDRELRNEPFFCEGVDLNCYLVREAQAMARIARALGELTDAARFDALADQRAAAVREELWDDEAGTFFDYHATERRRIAVRHVGVFAALWAGVATPEQAERLVRGQLLEESHFWRPWPVPALAASEPGYTSGYLPEEQVSYCSWRGHTWMPTNYYTFQGLRRYGYEAEARELAARSLALFMRARFAEYYCTELGIGTGRKPFCGWSALALFMQPELLGDVDATALDESPPAIGRVHAWCADGPAS